MITDEGDVFDLDRAKLLRTDLFTRAPKKGDLRRRRHASEPAPES